MAADIDRAKLLPRSGVGVVAPWLVIAPPGSDVIRLDLRALDRVLAVLGDAEAEEPADLASNLILECGALELAIYVADGPEAAARIAQEAAPFTRRGGGSSAEPGPILLVGNDVVHVRGEYIQAGDVAFRIDEVRESAEHGLNVPLTGGRLLQAAMAMLVVAVAERDDE